MPANSIRDLPKEVRDEISDEKYIAIEDALYEKFGLDGEQIIAYGNAVLDVILGRRPTTDFPALLSRLPRAAALDLRALALETALQRFWPISYYLKDVDILVSRLGGRIPQGKPSRPVATASAGDAFIQGTAQEILSRNRNFSELYITQKPIKDSDGRLRAPNITNWLSDYLHVMGADGSGALKRGQYVSKSPNAQRLNDAEKRNLLNFLASYEDNAVMYWRVAEGNYLLVEPELAPEEQLGVEQRQATQQLSDLIGYYRNIQRNYAKLFAERTKGIEVELSGGAKSVSEVIWDALGFEDAERCLAACDLAIDRRAIWDILKTDTRFRGIVSRWIDAKYGVEAKAIWTGDLTSAVSLAMLWRIMFVEKLKLEEGRAAILADYFTKKLGQKISPVYLDLKNGTFLFREIAYKDRTFSFV